MKTESLDALLTDRALGELTPEVRDLLAAYLALDPAAARRDVQFAATLTLVRQAVALPRAGLRPWRATGRLVAGWAWPKMLRRPVGRLALVAACLLVGIALGRYGSGRRPGPAAVASAAGNSAQARPAIGSAENVTQTPDFWSIAYLSKHPGKQPGPARAKEESAPIPWETLGQ